MFSSDLTYYEVLKFFLLIKMSIFRVIFYIRDEHETLVATLNMWKFRVVTQTLPRLSLCSSTINVVLNLGTS